MNGDDATKDMFSRLEASFASTRDDVAVLKQTTLFLQREFSDVKVRLDTLASKLEERSRTNWPAIGMAVAMLPVLGFVFTTYTNSVMAPIQRDTALNAEGEQRNADAINRLQQMAQASSAADVNSRTDRGQLNERVKLLENDLAREIADRRTDFAAMQTSLGEIETQFHAVSNQNNLQDSWQQRINALLWNKLYPGQPWPTGVFYPSTIFQGQGGAPTLQPKAPDP